VQRGRHTTPHIRLETKPFPISDLIEEALDVDRYSTVARSHDARHCQASRGRFMPISERSIALEAVGLDPWDGS